MEWTGKKMKISELLAGESKRMVAPLTERGSQFRMKYLCILCPSFCYSGLKKNGIKFTILTILSE
jgi:hypothetical protein